MLELGKKIKKRREELEMSQIELANKLGYRSRSTIAKIESGVNDIPQSKINDFASALLTTPSWLMGFSNYEDELDQISHDINILDAKVFFSYMLENLIEKFGYKIEDDFAQDKDGDPTVLFEGLDNDVFEIKKELYREFLSNCFSYIDYNFEKLINEKNRVESDYFVHCFKSDRTSKEPFELLQDYSKKTE